LSVGAPASGAAEATADGLPSASGLQLSLVVSALQVMVMMLLLLLLLVVVVVVILMARMTMMKLARPYRVILTQNT
jgi:uncharacterized SAM-binding protein YcdF (DUF218 family)